ncbi:MAG: shikimate dehydrogenase [Bacteroidales bacterium]|nr:shikimate dehydrogenase [Bacteroidales bacterium]
MRKYGLIGMPLGHSFSQKYFTEKFENEHIDAQYNLYPLNSIDEVRRLLADEPELCGFNVTIPYKEQIFKYLDSVDAEAQEVGAVNVVKIFRDGNSLKLKGFNSDIYGFYETIKPMIRPWHTRALILGTGGASKAVAAMMRKLGIEYRFVSRNGKDGALKYADIDKQVMADYTVLVNATPLGMFPNCDQCPDIPYNLLTDRHLAYDLIYNPLETKFLQLARQKGAQTKNGLEMLHLQAEKAWQIWQTNC